MLPVLSENRPRLSLASLVTVLYDSIDTFTHPLEISDPVGMALRHSLIIVRHRVMKVFSSFLAIELLPQTTKTQATTTGTVLELWVIPSLSPGWKPLHGVLDVQVWSAVFALHSLPGVPPSVWN